jgi:broad specificity phosphatase PhoE
MLDALGDIAARHPGSEVLVVSHGGVIRAARRLLQAPDVRLANLAGSWFSVARGQVTPGDQVDLIDHARPATDVS